MFLFFLQTANAGTHGVAGALIMSTGTSSVGVGGTVYLGTGISGCGTR